MVLRVCQVVKVKPEKLQEYKEIHQNVWQPVLSNLSKYHIKDYSIHYLPEQYLLIANFKYLGDNWAQDSEQMRNDPDNQKWWKITDGMQESLIQDSTGSTDSKGWWLNLEEVFRFEG